MEANKHDLEKKNLANLQRNRTILLLNGTMDYNGVMGGWGDSNEDRLTRAKTP